jgi:hypothetical protein
MARQMNEGEVLHTMNAFNTIDMSDDGVLSKTEFVEGKFLVLPKK